jgi:Winged helix DNA-binding domain
MVPANDLEVFTTGAMPFDATSFRQMLGGWAPALEKAGLDPFDLLHRLVRAAAKLLDGKSMDVNELRDRLYARVRSLHEIERPESARDDMPEPLFRAIGTIGAVGIVSGRGTDSVMARTDQWLKPVPEPMDPNAARAELARRFLRCYGPATVPHFAEWTQRSLADARQALGLIEDELADMTVQKKKLLLLMKDVAALESPPGAKGVRLLPVQDPYLQQRDRATLLPDQTARRRLWQAVRGPGALLLDGAVTGTWRGRVKGDLWDVEIEPFGRRPIRVMDAIVHEAESMAPFKECSAARVEWTA